MQPGFFFYQNRCRILRPRADYDALISSQRAGEGVLLRPGACRPRGIGIQWCYRRNGIWQATGFLEGMQELSIIQCRRCD